jgi:pyruvate dehydrogenase E1 component beta subunit
MAEYQGAYKVTRGLLGFGDKRVIDTDHRIWLCRDRLGAAMGGLKPVIEFMTFNFAMQAIGHIINSAAKTNHTNVRVEMRCPVVFRGPNGAAAASARSTARTMARGMPACPADRGGRLMTLRCQGPAQGRDPQPGPVVFLENELVYGRTFELPRLDDFVLPIGKARVVREART